MLANVRRFVVSRAASLRSAFVGIDPANTTTDPELTAFLMALLKFPSSAITPRELINAAAECGLREARGHSASAIITYLSRTLSLSQNDITTASGAVWSHAGCYGRRAALPGEHSCWVCGIKVYGVIRRDPDGTIWFV